MAFSSHCRRKLLPRQNRHKTHTSRIIIQFLTESLEWMHLMSQFAIHLRHLTLSDQSFKLSRRDLFFSRSVAFRPFVVTVASLQLLTEAFLSWVRNKLEMSKTARWMCLIFQGLIKTGFNVELRNNNVIEDMKDTLPSRGLQRQQNCRSAEDDKVQILDTAVISSSSSKLKGLKMN